MQWMIMTNNQIETIANEVLEKYVARGGVFKQFQNIIKNENLKYKEVNSKSVRIIKINPLVVVK